MNIHKYLYRGAMIKIVFTTEEYIEEACVVEADDNYLIAEYPSEENEPDKEIAIFPWTSILGVALKRGL